MNQFDPNHWVNHTVFYHIYPLGFCGAPVQNNFGAAPIERIQKVANWLPHLRDLGVNALYLGPLFESTAHGYDTADYYHVDRRLGTDAGLSRLAKVIHDQGMRLILDGVFNHVGRDFWAFRDVRENLANSAYKDWFQNLNFAGHSPYGDPFAYEGWAGNYDLVKLNLRNPDVKAHLFDAIRSWVERFDIDGLRLDAADCLDLGFLEELHSFVHTLKPDFWLMGEIVSGDYRIWANPQRLDSVTNYECYKGLYSSLAEKNYFEIAYALKRQFGAEGLYRGLPLYNFADNHDVNRVAGNLPDPALLYPLYCLLFTMPGVPSLYYGSEWGLNERRTPQSDTLLRPCLDLAECQHNAPVPHLERAICQLISLRQGSEALRYGDYTQIYVSHEQLAFLRESDHERLLVVLNAQVNAVALEVVLPHSADAAMDLLNPGTRYTVGGTQLFLPDIPPRWARVLRLE